VDATEEPDRANGIKFREASVRALSHAIRKALALFHDGLAMERFRHNAMEADFSWDRTAQEYLRVYRRVTHPEL
jgi:starch synthase